MTSPAMSATGTNAFQQAAVMGVTTDQLAKWQGLVPGTAANPAALFNAQLQALARQTQGQSGQKRIESEELLAPLAGLDLSTLSPQQQERMMMMANSGQWSKAYGAIQTPAKPPTGIPNIAPTTTPQATDWWNQFLRPGPDLRDATQSGKRDRHPARDVELAFLDAGGGRRHGQGDGGSWKPADLRFGWTSNPWASPTPGPNTGPVAPTYPDLNVHVDVAVSGAVTTPSGPAKVTGTSTATSRTGPPKSTAGSKSPIRGTK